MPPAKPQTVYGLPGRTLDDVKASLQPRIDAFLGLANRYPGGPQDDALRAIRDRRPRFAFTAWPPWAVEAVLNIRSNVRSGDYHLRQCVGCGYWMLVKQPRHVTCNRAACKRARNTRTKIKTRAAQRRHELAALNAERRAAGRQPLTRIPRSTRRKPPG